MSLREDGMASERNEFEEVFWSIESDEKNGKCPVHGSFTNRSMGSSFGMG